MPQDSLQFLKDSTQLASEVLDFIPPEKVDLSPTGPGWYILGGIAVLLVLIVSIREYNRYLNSTYKRVANKDLDKIINQKLSLQESVFQVNTTLKRVALTSYDRDQVAHLSGEEWVTFLNKHWKNNFSDKESDLLINGAYMKPSADHDETLTQLIQSSKKWIKSHV
ncbi:DUF4381 domain-containing protein [Flammeovirga aprica]|uniref:DUF4381 domain-containing protein n=1 Tax=Flammeovirga aprica JL-4 TaxID=694437 RepID=A0A7X9P2P1_9BACT|nr:DUF4381 domain-containing protein [Flammeovirga aprica]NME67302.1 DUF4381 domain-containing protein [Flammeovirga aprica JL-4]